MGLAPAYAPVGAVVCLAAAAKDDSALLLAPKFAMGEAAADCRPSHCCWETELLLIDAAVGTMRGGWLGDDEGMGEDDDDEEPAASEAVANKPCGCCCSPPAAVDEEVVIADRITLEPVGGPPAPALRSAPPPPDPRAADDDEDDDEKGSMSVFKYGSSS